MATSSYSDDVSTVSAAGGVPRKDLLDFMPSKDVRRDVPSSFAESKTVTEATSYVLDIIKSEKLDEVMQNQVMEETISFWSEHVNPGFLQYRKSVAEGMGFAAIEWKDGKPGGSTVIDTRGQEFIDCLGGYGIYNVGHSHPVVVETVKRQMEKQCLHSQELLDPLRTYCAAVLAKTLPGDLQYAFFTNSGTESVEACLKFAMLSTGRKHFLGVIGAFHGKTLGSLSATSKSAFRKPFINGLLSFNHVPVNDIDALRKAFESSRFTGNEIAGFIVEPVLGEGGIHLCSSDFLRAARALCDEYGACLIFDEVQSGMGRTGEWWACQHAGVAPDLMAIGKAFGGGVTAAGAAVGTKKVWEKYFENPFLHTTTFGGNPVAMAAAIATIHVLETENLVTAAKERGAQMIGELRRLQKEFPHILKQVRGRGLMIGLEFHDDEIGYAFARGVFTRNVLIAGTLVNSRVIRVEPPLTITPAEVDEVMARFADVLAHMNAQGMGVKTAPASVAGCVPAKASASASASAAPHIHTDIPAAAAAASASAPSPAAASASALVSPLSTGSVPDIAFSTTGMGGEHMLDFTVAEDGVHFTSHATTGTAAPVHREVLVTHKANGGAGAGPAPSSPAPAAAAAPAAPAAADAYLDNDDDDPSHQNFVAGRVGKHGGSRRAAGAKRSSSTGSASAAPAAAATALAAAATLASPALASAAASASAAAAEPADDAGRNRGLSTASTEVPTAWVLGSAPAAARRKPRSRKGTASRVDLSVPIHAAPAPATVAAAVEPATAAAAAAVATAAAGVADRSRSASEGGSESSAHSGSEEEEEDDIEDSDDTEVSSVSTSSEEEDDRRFDPRPGKAGGLAVASPTLRP